MSFHLNFKQAFWKAKYSEKQKRSVFLVWEDRDLFFYKFIFYIQLMSFQSNKKYSERQKSNKI